MNRTPRTLAFALLASTALATAAQAQECTTTIDDALLTEPGKLTMAVSPTLPPMAYADSEGTLKGLRIELGAEIAKRLCLEADFISTEYATMVPGLQGGRWDLIDAGLFVTPERLEIMYMIPYENLAISISTTPGDSSIQGIEDLSGKRVSTDIGGYAERKMRELNAEFEAKGMEPIDIALFDNYATVYQALRAGQVEAAVSIDPVAKLYKETGEFDHAIGGLYATPGSLSFGSTEIAEPVTKVMQEMNADGWLPALMESYGVSQADDGAIQLKGPGL
ncbi:transporter substrate-binding domain-containing protein [Oceanicola sp. S124]|uniref:transporter substrate-binding domain-containing protein n=1 Tax=Oceanicola sp. S124 TaxID=1042378 RepID=UPI00030F482B|nr:transporter substrate-binding domain-containing protein [Oceanicola sp. S124]